MGIETSPTLLHAWPALGAGAWRASAAPGPAPELPSLRETASGADLALRRARNMSGFFRQLGGRGRSPVEFQLAKAAAGELDYSQKNILIDFLLYAEIWTGLLIGFHDAAAIGDQIRFGLAIDALEPTYEHISRQQLLLRPGEPVLIAGERIIGSLRHGPDFATRVTSKTRAIWGVAFGSLEESADELSECAIAIQDAGVSLGVWLDDAK